MITEVYDSVRLLIGPRAAMLPSIALPSNCSNGGAGRPEVQLPPGPARPRRRATPPSPSQFIESTV